MNSKTANAANFGGKRQQTKYIVVHWTSNQGDTAKNNADYFARQAVGAGAHFFVDEREVWQSVPEDRIAYHCGAKTYRHIECRNANSLGVEICMTGKGYVLRPDSIGRAAALVRDLMARYQVPPERVLRHYDVTGKDCPGPMVQDPGLWQDFQKRLIQEDETMQHYRYVPEMPAWAQDTFTRLVQAGFVAQDGEGRIDVLESSLQPLVLLDRLTGGQLEKLPEILKGRVQ